MQQIVDIDEKNQVVQVNAWIRYVSGEKFIFPLNKFCNDFSAYVPLQIWYDYKLVWTPSEYGGIRDVRFPGTADQIWKPDILLYNRYVSPLIKHPQIF